MSIKIYNSNLNAIKIGHGISGPEFYINTERSIRNFYPTVGDWSSGATLQATVNMGQEPFQGDPLGFQPYDVNYMDSNWFGSGTVNSGVLTPTNIDALLYDKRYTSGKYYYEIKTLNNGLLLAAFLDGSSSYSGSARSDGVGVGVRGSDVMFTWTDQGNDYDISGADNVGTGAGHIFQVWADFDNDILCVKRLGTTIDDYQNVIEA